MQPALATFADKNQKIEIRKIITTIVAIAIALSAILLVVPSNQVNYFYFDCINLFINDNDNAANEYFGICF